MVRMIWCYECAADGDVSEGDLRSETQTVRWGIVSRRDLVCDRCNCRLPGGQGAACITHHESAAVYLPWELGYVTPLEIWDEDIELEADPKVREFLVRLRELDEIEFGGRGEASGSNPPGPVRDGVRGGEESREENMKRSRAEEDPQPVTATEVASYVYCPEAWRLGHGLGLPSENQAGLRAGVTHHEAMAAVEVRSTAALRLALCLIALAGVLLGLAYFGG